MGIFDIFKREKDSPFPDEEPVYAPIQERSISNDQEDAVISQEMVDKLIDMIAQKRSGYRSCEIDIQDPLLEDAARLVVSRRQGSTSLIQREFGIGYNRAGRIMDLLETFNVVGTYSGIKSRDVLIQDEIALEKILSVIHIDTSKFETDHKEQIENKVEYYSSLIEKERYELEKTFLESEKGKIKQQILEKKRKRELRKQAIEELQEEGLLEKTKKREPIPQGVQDAVWRRDGGRCVKCGSQENLEFDHIIPFSKGGSNTVRNLQLLCQKCNREKSNNIG